MGLIRDPLGDGWWEGCIDPSFVISVLVSLLYLPLFSQLSICSYVWQMVEVTQVQNVRIYEIEISQRYTVFLCSLGSTVWTLFSAQVQLWCTRLAFFTGRALRRATSATSPTLLLGGLTNYIAAGVAVLFVVAWEEYDTWMIDDLHRTLAS
jgi:hypothetical protein